ncbi:hypothetical protein [Streptomyces scopuliridis]|uniref:hypothetical protein n=1 Tax=Streptomyces scopuliridis TaxID=452529 RepID=UPI0034322FE3
MPDTTNSESARTRLLAMVTLPSEADEAEFQQRVEAVVAEETAELRSRVAELEAALCQCEPERGHGDYGKPTEYLHAAGCTVAVLQQASGAHKVPDATPCEEFRQDGECSCPVKHGDAVPGKPLSASLRGHLFGGGRGLDQR